jgi:hypothetical protein
MSKHERFAWIVVRDNPVMPEALAVGTWYECAKYQLSHGVRATTRIVYWG